MSGVGPFDLECGTWLAPGFSLRWRSGTSSVLIDVIAIEASLFGIEEAIAAGPCLARPKCHFLHRSAANYSDDLLMKAQLPFRVAALLSEGGERAPRLPSRRPST